MLIRGAGFYKSMLPVDYISVSLVWLIHFVLYYTKLGGAKLFYYFNSVRSWTRKDVLVEGKGGVRAKSAYTKYRSRWASIFWTTEYY